jgi:hypothetical protein
MQKASQRIGRVCYHDVGRARQLTRRQQRARKQGSVGVTHIPYATTTSAAAAAPFIAYAHQLLPRPMWRGQGGCVSGRLPL